MITENEVFDGGRSKLRRWGVGEVVGRVVCSGLRRFQAVDVVMIFGGADFCFCAQSGVESPIR